MKGKIVYTLKIHEVSDYEELNNRVEVFEKLDDAEKALKEFVDDNKQYVEKNDWYVNINTDMDFEAYLDGEYLGNHIVVSIEEQIIK